MSLALISSDGMKCPTAYFECNYYGNGIDLCDST